MADDEEVPMDLENTACWYLVNQYRASALTTTPTPAIPSSLPQYSLFSNARAVLEASDDDDAAQDIDEEDEEDDPFSRLEQDSIYANDDDDDDDIAAGIFIDNGDDDDPEL